MSDPSIYRDIEQIRGDLERLRKVDPGMPAVHARVYNSATISINHATLTILTFDSERWDTDNIHSTASNTSRLTCQHAGSYLITGHVAFAANTTGMRELAFLINGSGVIAIQDTNAVVSSVNTVMSLSTAYDLAVGDFVELRVYQTSGGALNVVAAAYYSPEFAMQRLP